MGWDYRVDKEGKLEIIISRWYNQKDKRVVTLIADGFEPNEPVQVEICGAEDE